MATLMEDLLFQLPEFPHKTVVYDAKIVRDRLAAVIDDDDLRRYIL
jgi:ATP-dependent protease HslVU (ClpYQ) ATPase subunit